MRSAGLSLLLGAVLLSGPVVAEDAGHSSGRVLIGKPYPEGPLWDLALEAKPSVERCLSERLARDGGVHDGRVSLTVLPGSEESPADRWAVTDWTYEDTAIPLCAWEAVSVLRMPVRDGGFAGERVVFSLSTPFGPPDGGIRSQGDGGVLFGSLDKELIRQVIKRNIGQIRYCYESELTRAPALSGKVAVKFVISGTGAVTSSSVASSTAGNEELETCVADRVRTWMFPKPKGGGVVVVTYPFIFKQSGGAQ